MNLWTSRFQDTGKLPHVLWDGERSGRLGDLAQRRKELRQYELESYAAIGRWVTSYLSGLGYATFTVGAAGDLRAMRVFSHE